MALRHLCSADGHSMVWPSILEEATGLDSLSLGSFFVCFLFCFIFFVQGTHQPHINTAVLGLSDFATV
jgi:hypothetical protein